jgi:hypothetical protein
MITTKKKFTKKSSGEFIRQIASHTKQVIPIMNKPPWSTGISARGENEYMVNLSNQYSNYNADLIKGQAITILIEGLFPSFLAFFLQLFE